MRENALLGELRGLFTSADPAVTVGSGEDDCAHVSPNGQPLAISIDVFTEGSHFTADAPPAAVARKSLGAALSDLAASAARARWALVALCLGPGTGGSWAGEFAQETARMAGEYGVTIIGGDTTASPLATTVTVTVIGTPLPGGPLLRRGARPGDALAVTGLLGGSIRGRHLSPEPRLAEIAWLMERERCRPSAGMDISDGMALDLSRLCRESGVGAIVDADAVPISSAARELARASGRTALEHALTDGEDFELLLALPAQAWEALRAAGPLPEGLAPFTRVGTVTAEAGLRLRGADGGLTVLNPEGYEHQW